MLTNSGRHASLDHEWLECALLDFIRRLTKRQPSKQSFQAKTASRVYSLCLFYLCRWCLPPWICPFRIVTQWRLPTNAFNWSKKASTTRGRLQFKFARNRGKCWWPYLCSLQFIENIYQFLTLEMPTVFPLQWKISYRLWILYFV